MPKKKRAKVSGLSKTEALQIGEEVVKNISSQPKKKEPSKRFNIRIPMALYERLAAITEHTGLSKSAIILSGLNSELNRMEKD